MAIGLFASGFPNALVNFCIVTSIKMVRNTGVLFMFDFVMVILGYGLSVFLYHESQSMICNGGILLILGGISGTLYYKRT